MTERYEYDVFGAVTIRDSNDSVLSVSSVANPYMFTGRDYDSETGLYYYRARYYKPSIGRFLQTDPIKYADSMNLHTYCGNNPVSFIDPYGLWNLKIGVAWGFGAILSIGRNNGKWSVSLSAGLGAGAIASFDSADTGTTAAGSGGGLHVTADASGGIVVSGVGVTGTVASHIGSRELATSAHLAGSLSAGTVGGSLHATGELSESRGLTGDVSRGVTVSLGALGFVGVGGHGTWGGDGTSDGGDPACK